MTETSGTTKDYIEREKRYLAYMYNPLPIVLNRNDGVWMWDTEGNKYLDFLGAYCSASFGHRNPRILKALTDQLEKMDVPARAFHTDKLGEFAEALCKFTGMDMVQPMNSGAEAVETGIKAARRWGYDVKKIPKDKARIIVCQGNFHGRTTMIVSFSSDEDYKRGFGPFDGGFDIIPYGDVEALKKAITPNTCAFLLEPIQGEGGILVPPEGYLREVQAVCKKNNVLLLLDEIQTGMGRTGKDFCFQYEIDRPDGLMLGKALGGGVYPVSAFLATREVMNVFQPGSHGSTFGGNPVASALGLESIRLLQEEKLSERSAELGAYLIKKLKALNSPFIGEVRGKGLLVGMEIDSQHATAREVCELLMHKGILSKETHDTVIRFSPPLTIEKKELDWTVERVAEVLREMEEEKASALPAVGKR